MVKPALAHLDFQDLQHANQCEIAGQSSHTLKKQRRRGRVSESVGGGERGRYLRSERGGGSTDGASDGIVFGHPPQTGLAEGVETGENARHILCVHPLRADLTERQLVLVSRVKPHKHKDWGMRGIWDGGRWGEPELEKSQVHLTM